MANRAQRRAQAKKPGRTTAKKAKTPTLFADVTDEAGNTKRIRVHGERVSAEDMKEAEAKRFVAEQAQRAAAEREEARMRLEAHAHGLWLPGDPIPGQG